MKSILKFSVLFILVVCLSVGSASVSFLVTKNILKKEASLTPKNVPASLESTYHAENASVSEPSQKFDFYTVRLEGDSLNVYASHGENEEFLYNAEICSSDLSSEDTLLLTSGVTLENSSRLTEFLEDFTS